MRFVGHVMRRGKIEDLSLIGRIPPGCRARGRQREKYMDGIIRTVGDGSQAVHILRVTRDRERERDVAIHGRQHLQGHGTAIR